jgi:NAD(P)-dependent dehydrogenase (short-subunit alcohol dehydrogenase family)
MRIMSSALSLRGGYACTNCISAAARPASATRATPRAFHYPSLPPHLAHHRAEPPPAAGLARYSGTAGGGRVGGKTAVVTGGGGGLGQALCVRLADEGATVFVWETDAATGAETLALLGGPAAGEHKLQLVDVTNENQIAAAVAGIEEQTGGVDILVNNAAVFVFKSVEHAEAADWDLSHDVLIKGTAFACKHVIPSMRGRGGGSIVNLGSICGVRAHESFAVYNTAKAGLVNLTRSVAMDCAVDNIRCNIVCPGAIMSGGTVAHAEAEGVPLQELVDTLSRSHMIPRMGRPREVADAVLFLASDEASFITAHPLMVDGGWAGKP